MDNEVEKQLLETNKEKLEEQKQHLQQVDNSMKHFALLRRKLKLLNNNPNVDTAEEMSKEIGEE
jgi:hypothetical protein